MFFHKFSVKRWTAKGATFLLQLVKKIDREPILGGGRTEDRRGQWGGWGERGTRAPSVMDWIHQLSCHGVSRNLLVFGMDKFYFS